MQDTLYHSLLRISMVVVAVALVFDSGLFSPVTKQLSSDTKLYLAQAVGMYAAIEPNELNTITAELTAREQELAKREAALTEREIAVDLDQSPATSTTMSTWVMSLLLFIILVLVILNYILDFWRGRQLLQVTRQSA